MDIYEVLAYLKVNKYDIEPYITLAIAALEKLRADIAKRHPGELHVSYHVCEEARELRRALTHLEVILEKPQEEIKAGDASKLCGILDSLERGLGRAIYAILEASDLDRTLVVAKIKMIHSVQRKILSEFRPAAYQAHCGRAVHEPVNS